MGIDDQVRRLREERIAAGEPPVPDSYQGVTSDGEVDRHKVEQLTLLSNRSGFVEIGFTTAYRTWKDAAVRQGRHKNLATDTWVWIAEDAGKHFLAQVFPEE